MFIKIVGEDESWERTIECKEYRITRCKDATFLNTDKDATEYVINRRNIFIMNNEGKTIDKLSIGPGKTIAIHKNDRARKKQDADNIKAMARAASKANEYVPTPEPDFVPHETIGGEPIDTEDGKK